MASARAMPMAAPIPARAKVLRQAGDYADGRRLALFANTADVRSKQVALQKAGSGSRC